MSTPVAEAARTTNSKLPAVFEPLPFVVVRTPVLPFERYLELGYHRRSIDADPLVESAVAVGSPALARAIQRAAVTSPSRGDADRIHRKSLRYLIRMSTRPTPYGMFAGVGLANWGERTNLRVTAAPESTRTRPDMAWLMAVIADIEKAPAVRKRLRFVRDQSAFVKDGRLMLTVRGPRNVQGHGDVSVRASEVALRAMSLAATLIPYEELAGALLASTPGATVEKVDALLATLWDQGFLTTDLWPPVTDADPARHVLEKLDGITEAAETAAALGRFRARADAWDRLGDNRRPDAFLALSGEMEQFNKAGGESPLQVDSAIGVSGELAAVVGEEAARAAELLVRISPFPNGMPWLTAYRQSFINRYGENREVLLVDLFDMERGLGPPNMHAHGVPALQQARVNERARVLERLAFSALANRRRCVFLTEDMIARLETWRPEPATTPASVDLNLFVSAPSEAAIDEGDFTVIVGPNLGALSAGRNLARFAHMLEGGIEALSGVGTAEEERTPGHIWAEMVYYPSSARSTNVIVRPGVRRYEIPFGATPNPRAEVIPWQELVVGVSNGRFYLRWPACDRRVVVTSGHMLNMSHAPAVGRFMVDLSHDAMPVMSTFEWGPAENFPYLPRVQYGRITLRPAQWTITSDDVASESNDAFLDALNSWRTEWHVPRHVSLSVGDNRLVLDLDSADQALEIRSELQQVPEHRPILLQEVLPAFDNTWLRGPAGHYAAEFVVSLVRRTEPARVRAGESADSASVVKSTTTSVTRPAVAKGWTAEKFRPPGTEWLFIKIYCERQDEDALLSGPVRGLTQAVLGLGKAQRFFVVRYSDPDPHIRLRFNGDPRELTGSVYPLVCDWANALMSEKMCRRFVFDSYEQEIDRFGGPAGLDVAHEIFCADSQAVLDMLTLAERRQWPDDRMTLVIASVDLFLSSLGLGDRARLDWYGRETTKGDENVGADYRTRKNVLRAALALREAYAPEFRDIFESRAAMLAHAGERLQHLEDSGELTTSLDQLYATFVHLHVNRLGGLDGPAEQRALMLLLRVRDSLAKAPFRS